MAGNIVILETATTWGSRNTKFDQTVRLDDTAHHIFISGGI